MADDTTNVSEHTQMVIVLLYELNGEIFELFLGFFIPENQTADGILKCILEQLNRIVQGNRQKPIAQTFDDANVMKGKKAGVQAKIKAVYSNAHFIHCYAHQLNLVMKNEASIRLLEMQEYFSLTFWLFQHSSQDHCNMCPFSRSMWMPAFHVLPLQGGTSTYGP